MATDSIFKMQNFDKGTRANNLQLPRDGQNNERRSDITSMISFTLLESTRKDFIAVQRDFNSVHVQIVYAPNYSLIINMLRLCRCNSH